MAATWVLPGFRAALMSAAGQQVEDLVAVGEVEGPAKRGRTLGYLVLDGPIHLQQVCTRHRFAGDVDADWKA
jgi:predicted oxidoreductase